MESEKSNKFEYAYSAKEQAEIRSIRDKYLPPKEDKLQQLRQLDASASRPGAIVALLVGFAGTLLLGLGMTCTMKWGDALFVPGIFIGLLGILGICFAYPLYQRITKKHREKIAPMIQKLAEKLMQE